MFKVKLSYFATANVTLIVNVLSAITIGMKDLYPEFIFAKIVSVIFTELLNIVICESMKTSDRGIYNILLWNMTLRWDVIIILSNCAIVLFVFCFVTCRLLLLIPFIH